MNRQFTLAAGVFLVLGLVSLWVLRSAQGTYALSNEPYTPFTELRMLAADPTATPDRHDLNVGRYFYQQTADSTVTPDRHDLNVGRYLYQQTADPTATPDRHDLNVRRYRLSAAASQTPDRHDRNVMRYRLSNGGTK